MGDVVVASTTDELADVQRAAGMTTAEIAAATPEPEQQENQPGSGERETLTTVQEAEGEAEQVEGEETDQEPEQHEVRRPKNAVQKRIDKLTAKNYALEEEKQLLEERLTRLERQANKQEPTQQAAQPQGPQFAKARPVQTDPKFKDYDEFIEALTDWKLEKKDFDRGQEQIAQQQAQQQQRLEQTFKTYNTAVRAFAEEHPDYDEVVGREDLQLPISVMNAIVGLRDKGPEIAYTVAQDEDLCNHLSQMAVDHGDAVALTEFGRYLASMEPDAAATQERPAARRSGAPAPIKPVGNSSTRSQVPIDELDFRDYRRIRDEAERARYRH